MRRWIVSLGICIFLLGAAAVGQVDDLRLETDVKATFLFQFTRYTDWPAKAFPSDTSAPFRVCTLSDEAFAKSLDRILEGETAAGRVMIRVPVETLPDARVCNVLYIGRGNVTRGEPLLVSVEGSPVLTVSDTPDFLRLGGQIVFVRENKRVRFDVNLPAVRRSGISLRSQLLRLARHVILGPDGLP